MTSQIKNNFSPTSKRVPKGIDWSGLLGGGAYFMGAKWIA